MMVSESGEGVGCAHQLEEPEREEGGGAIVAPPSIHRHVWCMCAVSSMPVPAASDAADDGRHACSVMDGMGTVT